VEALKKFPLENSYRQCARGTTCVSTRSIVRGFTLVELCVTVAVLVILSTIAAASMNATISNNRVYATQDEFVAYLAYARSEAVRRGATVIVGATNATRSNAFAGGWQVWVDANANGDYDNGETKLRVHERVGSSMVVGDGTTTAIAFTALGFLSPPAAVDVKVCPTDHSLSGFDIVIQPNGLTDVKDVAGGAAPCN
jgi:type IV fimbrial biogenesis protein FimT